jgi:hypothetical protein
MNWRNKQLVLGALMKSGHDNSNAAPSKSRHRRPPGPLRGQDRELGTILNDWNPKRSPNEYCGCQHGYFHGGYRNDHNGYCGAKKTEG